MAAFETETAPMTAIVGKSEDDVAPVSTFEEIGPRFGASKGPNKQCLMWSFRPFSRTRRKRSQIRVVPHFEFSMKTPRIDQADDNRVSEASNPSLGLLGNLPFELVLKILEYVAADTDKKYLFRLGQVSKKCSDLVFHPFLWRSLVWKTWKDGAMNLPLDIVFMTIKKVAGQASRLGIEGLKTAELSFKQTRSDTSSKPKGHEPLLEGFAVLSLVPTIRSSLHISRRKSTQSYAIWPTTSAVWTRDLKPKSLMTKNGFLLRIDTWSCCRPP